MTLAQDALALVEDVFTDPDMVGIVRRAAIRYSIIGEYANGIAPVERVDLPCLAMLLTDGGEQPPSLEIPPRAETWLLQGVSRGTSGGAWNTLDPDPIMQDEPFIPREGHLLLVERVSGGSLAEWTGGVQIECDAKSVLSAQDLSVGIGALWQVTVRGDGA